MTMMTMDGKNVAGIILAAGRGRRMRSRIAKPLHCVAGRELARYPAELLAECGIAPVVVVVAPEQRDAIAGVLGEGVIYALQATPDGTAGAAAAGIAALPEAPGTVVIMGGDTPLVRPESVCRLVADHTGAVAAGRRMTILSAAGVFAPDLGVIARAGKGDRGGDNDVDGNAPAGPVTAIVEASDRAGDCFGPAEVNTGVYCFDRAWLAAMLPQIPPSASGERYLTALATLAASEGDDAVAALPAALADEAMGVNDRLQLAGVEAALRDRINCHWMRQGVTIMDTATTYIDAGVTIGADTVLLPNTMLRGATVIGEECEIGPNAVISDTAVGDRCRVAASFLEGAQVHSEVSIGPYSHLRPGAVIERGAHLGNYVEVKNSRIGADSAAGHFCYLGDADIGGGVNIGAGAVTCNYDGVDKHRTVIGDGAFIGSDTMLIAPVSVGKGAATGAGAVVTKDIPDAGRAVGVPARLLPSAQKREID